MDFTNLYTKAVDLAFENHVHLKKQKHGNRDYTEHLKEVQATLGIFGFSPDKNNLNKRLYIAAWLHDIVEDTDITIEQIREIFGGEIADLVWAVTNEPGKNRAERHAKTYPKLLSTPNAMILKLADRIANVEACYSLGNKKLLQMYLKEWEGFRRELYSANPSTDEMWAHLEKLLTDSAYAFEIVFHPSRLGVIQDDAYTRSYNETLRQLRKS